MEYKLIVGLEVHVQLGLKTKAFCRCRNDFGGIPNSRTCPTCLGLPGALPSVNKELINSAILAGHATNSEIRNIVKFDRKHYAYPDLPKGYQISQNDEPICENGFIFIKTYSGLKKINIIRIHMEEDSGKSLHLLESENRSYIDFNRAGAPLLEIVSSPDINSGEEAVAYLIALREIFRYLDLSECSMENGSFRCDVNVNLLVNEKSVEYKTPIAEIKNLNSFKSIKSAIDYEESRQKEEWILHRRTFDSIGKYTMSFDDKRGVTTLQRSKETVADYRYMKEPDLPLIKLDYSYIESIKDNRMVELPFDARIRLKNQYGLSDFDVVTLTSDKNLVKYFEETAMDSSDPKRVANWILSEVLSVLNDKEISILNFSLSPSYISELVEFIVSGKVSGKIAKEVFLEMLERNVSSAVIINEKNLEQISDESFIESIVIEVLNENPKSIELYKKGKSHAIRFMMGQIMRKASGKVNPILANEILMGKLRDV
ncbi:Aspartyl/glutamyl-tRNA(Asn/Gln) amidotransferase subunit B [Borrelia miyamotoi]|uniref:Aspartyl/glutamyl-tRNA(Asn/Gln) amidotransferase subunit B n=1 Tax=Borrelia miyamotoi TaxID=47466 RepID=A0AAP9CFW5_9SPIR|nr:Asp-tRNA(Asn)/Glu-tRNA(Gln) amidotransferase subunit GatB [Borrelia miyamotoi]AHH05073.1 Aspartyl/glutamyl-tRNA(Asn/Gln) amidotransferase subunit B [Borrelia miyamotoi FR64b]ATQ14870.1 Asp-tRNA(Asn)/Glu-tRNA(Gln) amidotransferase subunit GatB [Borrelia miyamotoi]ATQ16052.1 Asp-tRNA(Asn)/Glu-tRNA(Gln) amidotransferase subunit GatB [Borrelia miyamotoi]ATQ17198.1 Asp-tRNA(Asn)/Glu-tRNA(Gln) amidotransferase subunit GatB [Borrelia miyamotoi]ATQ18296.1 Asp-tRNA(Asn)/Glu-tRNA(Gln) amidotransferas